METFYLIEVKASQFLKRFTPDGKGYEFTKDLRECFKVTSRNEAVKALKSLEGYDVHGKVRKAVTETRIIEEKNTW